MEDRESRVLQDILKARRNPGGLSHRLAWTGTGQGPGLPQSSLRPSPGLQLQNSPSGPPASRASQVCLWDDDIAPSCLPPARCWCTGPSVPDRGQVDRWTGDGDSEEEGRIEQLGDTVNTVALEWVAEFTDSQSINDMGPG